MKLATYQRDGQPAIAIVEGGRLIDLDRAHAALFGTRNPAFGSMLSLIDAGPAALDLARETAQMGKDADAVSVDLKGATLMSPVPVPRQLRDFSVFETHIRQGIAAIARIRGETIDPATVEVPEVYRRQPIYYKGNRFSCVGDGARVQWPSYSDRLDFELEFGVFLSRTGRDVRTSEARDHIFGYAIFNDVSARDAQGAEMEGLLGPAKGKDFDTGNVIGPWIVTPDELGDPYDLDMSVHVNGEEWSRGHSRDMIHSFEDMIAWVSRDETLHAGEFLGSGTVGNGCGLELDRWIERGDEVSLRVDGLGTLTNVIGSKG